MIHDQPHLSFILQIKPASAPPQDHLPAKKRTFGMLFKRRLDFCCSRGYYDSDLQKRNQKAKNDGCLLLGTSTV